MSRTEELDLRKRKAAQLGDLKLYSWLGELQLARGTLQRCEQLLKAWQDRMVELHERRQTMGQGKGGFIGKARSHLRGQQSELKRLIAGLETALKGAGE